MDSFYKIILSFTFTFLLSTMVNAQHSVLGTTTLCDGDCETYLVSNGLGGPYFWISTGSIQGSNNGNEVEICWNTIGENDIQVVDFSAPISDQSSFQNINIYAYPDPEIIFPLYPECVVRDSISNPNEDEIEGGIECKTVCSGSTATYYPQTNNGSTITWEVEGGTILNESQEEITIQWNTGGSASIKITENHNGCSASNIFCIEILEPLEVNILALYGNQNEITICTGQEVYFQGLGSQNVTNFDWDFGNGTYASGSSVSAYFDAAGTYTVTLQGATECGCSDLTNYTVIVESNPGPEIMCTGTVCQGDESTYYAEGDCSSYDWVVSSNGIIIDGGSNTDDYITVNWNSGTVGELSLSTTGCNTPTCALPTTVQIPIINGTASIEGPTIACKEGYSTYSIQYYNGTDYIWTISGNGSIVDGYGTNEITVQLDDSSFSDDNATISVSYDNCHLNCGGYASIDVELLPDFKLNFSEINCANSQTYISALEGWNNATVSFTITDPTNTTFSYPNVTNISEMFSIPGEYTLTATDSQNLYCNDQITRTFEVIESPSEPTNLNGATTVCANEFYVYSVDPPSSLYSARWIITDGSNTQIFNTNEIYIQWTSNGPYEISVQYYLIDGNCTSNPLIIDIEPASTANIQGEDNTCVDVITNYNAGLPSGSSAVWSITPSDAGSINLNADNSINITWHQAGNHIVNTDFCGTMISYNVTVNPIPNTAISFPDKVCPGELAVVDIPTTAPFVRIEDENETIVSTLNNSLLEPGKYKAIITSAAGCEEIIPIVIDTFSTPNIRVSSPQENAFCVPHPGIVITALNTKDGYTYEWFHNGTSMGITTPQITTTDYGEYHVQVTDQNGCTAISNIHTLYEWCEGDQPPGTCSGGGNIGILQIGATSLTCNDLEFNLKGSTFTSTSFTWNFGDPESGPNNIASGNNPIHSFSNAGYYYVFLQGNVISERAVDIFTIPAVARFDYDEACENSAIQFNNLSTFIPGLPITNYSWDFGDPSSGANNFATDSDPQHIYTNSGTYTVRLEVTGFDGCISTYQQEIEVLTGPFAEFITPQFTCEDEGLLFVALESNDILTYEWDFDDPTSGAANSSTASTTIHTFSTNGTYNVTLTVSDINGCTSVITKTITITSTTLTGQITADKSFPMCFTEAVTLTAPSGGNGYLWSTGESTQTITTTKPGIYTVTISDPNGCQYVPDDVNVTVEGVIDTKIRGTVFEDESDFVGKTYFDSIVICQGDRFALRAPYLFNASYSWTMGTSTNWYNSSTDFSQLAPGNHEIAVSITDPNTGCIVASIPFKITVNSLPNQVVINEPSTGLCDGEVHTLSVDNPDSNLRYYWNNGSVGTSINVSASGTYSVIAVNENGCERESGNIWISKRPDANRINVGCVTACFPDTICTPTIANASTYQWLLDGSPINDVSGNDLIVNEAGDYQLIVANYNGCRDTSEVFTIDAEPNNQTLSGIVYIDEDKNGQWDPTDPLIPNVTVNIFDGLTLVSSTLTDASGYYLFDPINTVNPFISIDTTGLGIEVTGGLFDANTEYKSCIEDKVQDFALFRDCALLEVMENRFTCKNETIIVNNVVLAEGDTYTFTDQTTAGCDSTTLISVSAFPEPDIQLTPQNTCTNSNDGTLEITIMDGSTLQFAIDTPTAFTTDLIYTNLSAGDHTLWLYDIHGCATSYPFSIKEEETPNMSTLVENTCLGGNSGSIDINPITSGNYEYSLDGVSWNSSSYFDQLSAGMNTIYTLDLNSGCIHEYPIQIEANPEPQIELSADNNCPGMSEGRININPLSSGNFEYSIDGVNFVTDLYFDSLISGSYDVYIKENDNCIYTRSISIIEEPTPTIVLDSEDACQGESNGTIIINSILNNLEYSIDQINFTTDTILSDLEAGTYDIYVREDNGCVHTYDIEIQEASEMDVVFEDPTTDCTITEVVLNPIVNNEVGGVSFLWSDGSTESTFTTATDGSFGVEVSDKCTTRSYDYDVEIEEIIKEQPIYFPNIFSPDQNGVNDCFVPTINKNAQVLSYRMLIFDRWGNKYFETTDMNECWDGSYNNQDVRAGVFVYLVELEYTYCVEVESIKKYGDVTVID